MVAINLAVSITILNLNGLNNKRQRFSECILRPKCKTGHYKTLGGKHRKNTL